MPFERKKTLSPISFLEGSRKTRSGSNTRRDFVFVVVRDKGARWKSSRVPEFLLLVGKVSKGVGGKARGVERG